MKIKKNIHQYLEKNGTDIGKMEAFAMFVEEFFEGVEEEYKEIAIAFKEELDDFVYEIDEEVAIFIVENLKKRDGTVAGVKWSKEETNAVAKQNDVERKIAASGKPYDCLKFWIAMNYVYAVHYNVNRTTNGYIELAIDELTNRNICFEDLVKKISKKI
jgi:hypothetical protein